MADNEANTSSYKRKRDFDKTPEPDNGDAQLDWASERPIFVIQKHAATSLHYDFRIEVDGTLKSWAVPKGPSTNPGDKRLAMPTEDHPLTYANFEGVIPADEYGGGTVMIWDRGSYQNLKDDKSVAAQLDEGHVTIYLKGEKIYGGYALIRTDSGDDARWLLIKMDDNEADARRNPTSTENKSVASDRTLDQIKNEESADD